MKKFYPMALLLRHEGYPPAVIASLVLHGLLVVFILGRTVDPSNFVEVKDPVLITASTVKDNPQRLRRLDRIEQQRLADERAQRERAARQAREAQAAREARERQTREDAEQQRRLEQARQKAADEEAERARLAEQERARQQQIEQAREQQRLADEQSARAAQEAQANQVAAENLIVAEYSAKIRRIITQNWVIPAIGRNGMTVLVRLQLVPTGEVVGVNIIQSSGNDVFDRSAVQAVEKAGSFPELQDLDNAVFERNFRTFELLFRPEDLLR